MSKNVDFSKIQEIRKYYSAEDYEAAAGLADDINWSKVKSWDALGMMTDIYENLGEYENARDMAILAYNRNLGGKRLVYKLTDLLVKTGDKEDAEDMFNEYCSMSRNAPDSYILEYHLLRARNAPDTELIRVLEEYKEREPNDTYMYRLAELYAKNGNKEKCAEVCDNIILWFKDGDFVEGATKLKKKVGASLSPEQEKIFGKSKVKDEDLSKTGKVDLKGHVLRSTQQPEDDEDEKTTGGAGAAAAAAAAGGAAAAAGAGAAAGKFKSLVKNVFEDDDIDNTQTNIPVRDIAEKTKDSEASNAKDVKAKKDDFTIEDFLVDPEEKKTADDKEDALKESISADVAEELDNESALRGKGVIEGEEQIDGQMNMNDWMTDVREKKYSGQSTKEYSKTELERLLEEKDEKSKAYDRLMAEQKKIADAAGKPFNEAQAKRKVEEQLAVSAARRDLDIRTGKGSVKQETEVASVNVTPAPTEERPQEETILGAVLEAAGTEAVREAAGSSTTPSDRMLRIESAVLGLLGAKLSDNIASRSKSAPTDVVDAAALLVKYISGEYDAIKQGQRKETVKVAPVISKEPAKGTPVTPKEPARETPVISKETEGSTEKSPTAQPPKAEQPKEAPKAEQPKEAPKTEAPKTEEKKPEDTSKGKIAAAVAAAATATAGGAAAAGGVLHEKAKKAKEVFEGGVTPEPKAPKAEETKPEPKAAETKPEDAPDLSKMRLKKVTDEDVEANLTDDEAAVAQKITDEDRAVDVITARITAPISTAEIDAAIAASENGEIDFKDSDTFTDTTHIDKKMLREIIESSAEEDESEGKNTRRFDTTQKQDTAQLDNVLREDLPKGKREKIKSMFEEYYDMPEIDAQIEEYIASLPTEITREDSRNGNIVIAGAEAVDKTGLAKTIAKAVNISYPKKKKKVIKTTGDNLNTYGFAKSADKLKGSFIIIENAGLIRPEIISEIVDVMRKDTDRMIVIAEDTEAGIESFINSNPALPKLFNHRINMRPFTTGELVEIAKDLAKQKGYKVNEEGALALYLEVDELRAQEGKVTIEDMDALTDDAIAHARKRIKKEAGANVKKGEEQGILTNDDFRY